MLPNEHQVICERLSGFLENSPGLRVAGALDVSEQVYDLLNPVPAFFHRRYSYFARDATRSIQRAFFFNRVQVSVNSVVLGFPDLRVNLGLEDFGFFFLFDFELETLLKLLFFGKKADFGLLGGLVEREFLYF